MEQRQLRLGDILDDYCPRERRVTNHAVVAMVGSDVKQTRCTTCDAEHEYKHAKVPRQRRKADSPAALYAQVSAGAPKRVTHEAGSNGPEDAEEVAARPPDDGGPQQSVAGAKESVPAEGADPDESDVDDEQIVERDEGPVHRPLIRASLPRPEGQPPPSRPIPEFTIRQPGGRPGHFRPRHARGGQPQFGNRSNGNAAGGPRSGGGHGGHGVHRQGGGRPPQGGMRRHGQGRKRSK